MIDDGENLILQGKSEDYELELINTCSNEQRKFAYEEKSQSEDDELEIAKFIEEKKADFNRMSRVMLGAF